MTPPAPTAAKPSVKAPDPLKPTSGTAPAPNVETEAGNPTSAGSGEQENVWSVPQAMLRNVPERYHALYRQAMTGKSRRAGVRAHCLMCMGWSAKEVTACTAPGCPLYLYRIKG